MSWFYNGGELIKLLRENEYDCEDIFDSTDAKKKAVLSYMKCERYEHNDYHENNNYTYTSCHLTNRNKLFKDIESLATLAKEELEQINLYNLFVVTAKLINKDDYVSKNGLKLNPDVNTINEYDLKHFQPTWYTNNKDFQKIYEFFVSTFPDQFLKQKGIYDNGIKDIIIQKKANQEAKRLLHLALAPEREEAERLNQQLKQAADDLFKKDLQEVAQVINNFVDQKNNDQNRPYKLIFNANYLSNLLKQDAKAYGGTKKQKKQKKVKKTKKTKKKRTRE
jgi:hypothetical protein